MESVRSLTAEKFYGRANRGFGRQGQAGAKSSWRFEGKSETIVANSRKHGGQMFPGDRVPELGARVKSKGFCKDRFMQTLGGVKFAKNTRVTIAGREFPLDAVAEAEPLVRSTTRPGAQDNPRLAVEQKYSVIVDPKSNKHRNPKYIDEIVSHQTGQTLAPPRDRSGSISVSSGSNSKALSHQTSRMNRFYQDMHLTD